MQEWLIIANVAKIPPGIADPRVVNHDKDEEDTPGVADARVG
jgi:hypothetical protein